MAMNYKAQATAQYLAQDLTNRTALVSVVDLSGTDPIVSIGTQTTTSIAFKVKVLDQRGGTYAAYVGGTGSGFSDIVGNAQPVYTGTVFNIYYEKAAANNWPNSASQSALLNIIGDLTRRGGRVELYASANGSGPDATSTNFIAAFEPSIYWSISGRA